MVDDDDDDDDDEAAFTALGTTPQCSAV